MSELNLEMVIELDDDDAFCLSKGILEGYFDKIYTDDARYLFACGQSSLCLTAHADTLRNGIPVKLGQVGEYLVNVNGILGADDRAGLFMIFKVLSHCMLLGIDLPSILITSEEEKGMLGAKRFVESNDFIRSDGYNRTDMIVGLDCSGHKRFVTYGKKLPPVAEKYITQFGFEKSMSKRRSDIVVLSKAFGLIPCVNVSVGYEYEHTRKERLHIENYIDSFQRVLKMVRYPFSFSNSGKKGKPNAESIRLRKNGG